MVKSFINKLKDDLYSMFLGVMLAFIMCTPFIILHKQIDQIVILLGDK